MWARFLAAALAALALAAPAYAQDGRWWRAETPNFVVYGDRSETQMREIARLLEDFDATLRRMTNPTTPPSPNKLIVYVVGDVNWIRQVRPGSSAEVRGFYRAGFQETAAFVIYSDQWGLRRNQVLFHEYAHHFMMHYFPYAYPRWYIEGWAEYVSTTEISDGSASVGIPSEVRGSTVARLGLMPIEDMLAPERRRRRMTSETQAQFYGQAWFATAVVFNNGERMRGLHRYVQALGDGADPIDAFEPAFGVTPEQFERELREARDGRIPRLGVSLPESTLQVTLQRLPRSADQLLLRVAYSRSGVPEEDAAQLAADLERYARPHPNDPFARLALARAAIHREDESGARTQLESILADDENNVEARYLLAALILRQAYSQSDAEAQATVNEARRHFVRNFRIDPNHAPTLFLYATTFAGGAPMSQAQLDVLARALELSPQSSRTRLLLARELMEAGQFDEAVIVLRPILYVAHEPSAAAEARTLFTAAQNRQPPPTQDEEPDDSEEAEDEGEN